MNSAEEKNDFMPLMDMASSTNDSNSNQKDKIIDINELGLLPVEITLQQKNLIDALNHACQWFCDMPFSKQPVILGSSIADVLDNKQLSIAFLEKGIISHPDDWQILNNLSYYYALSNQLEAAKKYIGRINYQNITPSAHVCATATKGLISFREKNYEAGRNLYLKAIDETSRIHNLELNWIAILNYAREEIIAKSEYIEDVMSLVSKINPRNCPDIIVKKLYQEVEDLYKKYKMTSV